MVRRVSIIFLYVLLISISSGSFAQTTDNSWDLRYDSINRMMKSLESQIPGLNEKITNSVTGVTIDEFLRAIAISSGVNISIDPALNFKVVNNFTDTKVSDLLLFLCNQYRFDISSIGNIIILKQIEKPVIGNRCIVQYDSINKYITLDVDNVDLSIVTQRIIVATGKNIISANGLGNQKISTYLLNMPVPGALEKVAYSNNLALKKTEDGTFVFDRIPAEKVEPAQQKQPVATTTSAKNASKNEARNENSTDYKLTVKSLGPDSLFLSAENAPISEVLKEVSNQSKYSYILTSIPKGEVTLQVNGGSYNEILKTILAGTDHVFKKQGMIYLIGNKTMADLMSQVLVQLQYRAVDSVRQILPKDLVSDIDVKIFREQNSIMLSGPADKVGETEKFIHSIDKLVPVVSIEVMIIDYNTSHTVSTGINAGISDEEVAPSSGSVFPSVDLNLNSSSINDLINRFNGFGWAKIGKVNSNFYAQIRALENNGVLNIRSTPILSTLNGHETTLTIGNTEYYLEEQYNIIGTQNPQSTKIQTYKPVNAELSVVITPIVSGDEQITLEIEVNQSDFTERISTTAPPGTVNRTFKSQIRVRNEEMILLGGLEENRNNKTSNGTPFLSRVPVIKWFFSSRNEEKSKSKLNIFIKPTIIS
ncbi:MAG TPA: type II and III secretion system protein [Bacteroidales bacterium]|nr:type II and III secretion system protein [Bacteroidales bacterium]